MTALIIITFFLLKRFYCNCYISSFVIEVILLIDYFLLELSIMMTLVDHLLLIIDLCNSIAVVMSHHLFNKSNKWYVVFY